VTVFAPHLKNPETGAAGPCYRCLYPEPPDPGSVPSCAEGGVIGVLPGIIGTMQANEVIKLILGVGKISIGRLTYFDAMDFEFRQFKVRRDPACPICGDSPTIHEPIDYEQFCGSPILDPKSLDETKREVLDAKNQSKGDSAVKTPDPSLDARGLPPGHKFNPEWEITPRDVQKKLSAKEKFVFIDCRLKNEWDITHIEGTTLLPVQQLAARIGELAGQEEAEIIVHCKSGGRSMQFAQMLKGQGFKNVKSMAGGILLWNRDINPGGPQY